MKKFLMLFMISMIFTSAAFAVDRYSAEYLRNKKHLSPISPIAECIIQKEIRKSLKKETGADFKVKFAAYNLYSLKAGIFKHLEITGQDTTIEGIYLPYVKFETVTDYNWIDYKKDPVLVKSDMEFNYEMELSEQSINDALKSKEYQKTIQNVNKRAYPLFVLKEVKVKVKNNRVYIIMNYNFPISPAAKDKIFFVSTDFSVEDGKIKATDIRLDKAYSMLSLQKVTNLINLLDPLSFTLDFMNSKKCKGKTENIKIKDDILQINGKIFVKA